MRNNIRLLILYSFIFSLTIIAPSFGADNEKKDCEAILSSSVLKANATTSAAGKKSFFTVIPSPRAPQDAVFYEDYVKQLTASGGILDQLGIEMTGQKVEFLIPRDLNATTSGSSGGFPIRHYLDGAQVLDSLKPSGGFALEVVYPGPLYQHGFYRDDNPKDQQVSIIDHVVGHNSFALWSGLNHYRVGQGLEASQELDQIFKRLQDSFDFDYVQRWYLWAQTLVPLMDWYTPYWQNPSEFEPKLGIVADPMGRNMPKIQGHPKSPTENVLQAFTANLAPQEPEWKRQVLEKLMVSMSFRPALVHTQIMNEGWASIMQEIIPFHTKENHRFGYWKNASKVMQTEAQPDLKDPYSLGVACWRHLKKRLLSKPENQHLTTRVEQDRAFILYAKKIIQTHTDEQFLRLAMDQEFVDKFNLAVVRRAKKFDPNLPPPPPSEQNPGQWEIVTREAPRVVNMVINRVLKPKYFFNPRVKLVNFNRPGSGEVELVLNDPAGREFPLLPQTLAPSLYALTQIIKKSVSLECTLEHTEVVSGGPQNHNGRFVPPWIRPPMPQPKKSYVRYRVTVAVNGEVKVYKIGDEGPLDIFGNRKMIPSEILDPAKTKEHTQFLAGYLADLYLEEDREIREILNLNPQLRDLAKVISKTQIEGTAYEGMVAQSHNASGAIMEYHQMVSRRLAAAMARALKGGQGVKVTSTGVRVKALPSVVNIQFDRRAIQEIKKGEDGNNNDDGWGFGKTIRSINRTTRVLSLAQNTPVAKSDVFGPDEGGDGSVGGISGEPGDHFWGPGQPPPGGEDSGAKPGEDPNDLSWVDIPGDLYSRFLSERVKLPKLNRKPGDSKTMATKRGGRINRRTGDLRPEDIMFNAAKRGVGAQIEQGNHPGDNFDETMELGFDNLRVRDWVVASKKPTRKPDIKAVVNFVLDASGSTARYYEGFKRFVNDMEALIRVHYKGFAFRYVVFDTQAHLMKNRDEFFKAQLGGGTVYEVGLQKSLKVMQDEYPRAQWDRFTFLLGDMEDWDPHKAFAKIKEILDDSEYFGVVAGLYSMPELMTMVQGEAQSNDALGVTTLNEDGTYEIKHIKEVLRNDPD